MSAPDITSMNKVLQYEASCFVSVLRAVGEERKGLRNGLLSFNTVIIIIIIIIITIISDGIFYHGATTVVGQGLLIVEDS